MPRPGRAGHLALNFEIIDWLQSQGCRVTVLLTGSRIGWPADHYPVARVAGPIVWRLGDFVVAHTPKAQLQGLTKMLLRLLPADAARALRRRRAGGADAVLGAFISPAAQIWCARYIAAARPGAVLIDTIFRAPLLRAPELAGINSLIIAHDVIFRRHRALVSAGYRPHPPELTAAMEADLLSLAGAAAAIQPREEAEIRRLCPQMRVFTAPMPARPCPPPPGRRRLADRLVFVGSAGLPNLDGLRWFFEVIWADLRRNRPDLALDLVGDCGGALPRVPPGVNRLGRVRHLAPILHRASLAIAPLQVGSGLKIKLLDYARHGLFTVATPASLAGFAGDDAAPFIMAADAVEFAGAILQQLAAGPADAGIALAYVARHYGVQESFAGIANFLHLPALRT